MRGRVRRAATVRSGRPASHRSAVAALLAALVLTAAPPARAQDAPPRLLLPSSAGNVPATWPSFARGLAARLGTEGLAVQDMDEARRLFERRESAPAAPVERTELEQLEQRIERAMVLVATGQRRGALREMTDGMELLRRASESINREATVARRAYDGCLITVRALLELRQREPARDRARECQRLFPDIEADPREHPPWVIGFLAEVTAELQMEPRGTLRVLTDRPDCGVYLQGLRVGATPFERGDFTPGEQRIQVGCLPARPGRVHRVILGAQPTTVDIDTRFDEAVDTTELLSLRYPTAADENRRRLADARRVARVLGAAEVLLLTPDERLVRVDRIRVADLEVVASIYLQLLETGPDRVEVQLGAAALLRGESADVSRAMTEPGTRWRPPGSPDTPPRATTPAPPARSLTPAARPAAGPSAAPDEPPSIGRLLGGGALLLTGASALGIGWYFYATTDETQGALDIGTGAVGGVLATLGVVVLKRREWGTPVGSLLGLAAGMSLAGIAIGAFVLDGSCKREDPATRACAAEYDSSDLGGMLLVTAAPLLALPLTQVVQKLTGPEEPMTVTASVSRDQLTILLRGAL